MTHTLTRVEYALKCISGLFTGPLGIFSVTKNNVLVIQRFGKVDRIVEPGLRWTPFWGVECTNIFMGIRTYKFEKLPMIDVNGSPIICSAVMNYKVINPTDFIINLNHIKDAKDIIKDTHDTKTNNATSVIYNMVEGVMRDSFKKLPLNTGTVNIRNSTNTITNDIINQSKDKINMFGVTIDNFIVTDVNYAPEVMQQMLMKQQAMAVVDARQELVNGVIGIINNTVEQMPTLSKEVRDKVIVNLFTTLTSNTNAQPVINTTN